MSDDQSPTFHRARLVDDNDDRRLPDGGFRCRKPEMRSCAHDVVSEISGVALHRTTSDISSDALVDESERSASANKYFDAGVCRPMMVFD
jgi:hypothetical protein